MKKIVELLIGADNFDSDELGVDVVSLVASPAIGYTWMAFSEEDNEMVKGIIELLNKVEDIDNRKQMAKDAIDDFIKEGVQFDLADFMSKVGLDLEDLKLEKVQDAILAVAEEFGQEHDPATTTYLTLQSFQDEGSVAGIADGIRALDILTGREDATEELQIVYKYEGPISTNSRKFCRAMVRLSANKFWTEPDVDRMSRAGVNSELAPMGQNTYDIFRYAGGARCNHHFVQYKYFRNPDGRTLLIKTGVSTDIPSEQSLDGFKTEEGKAKADQWYAINKGRFQKEYTFEVASEEKRIVVAPSMVPNNLIRRVDEKGMEYYVYFSKETVAKIAENYFANNFTNNTNINHSGDVTKTNTVLESWIVEDPETDKSKLYGFNVPEGTWMLSMRINDDATWEQVKSGQLKGYSVEGNFLELIK